MRLAAIALAAALALPAAAQQEGDEIAGVIGDQLSNFTARDVTAAFDHASPGIKRLFGSPENFGRMVAQGYPMVWDNAEARYLDLRETGGVWWQTVLIRDARGVPHLLEYKMIETAQGWRIDGVRLLDPPAVGA
ncbi:DUF4864 domain-containing protein [Limimaricola pyoseonensis]|uniref:DUF4864 domain-containing protein n=1 Tax=Limimaricola pyoseonensis TaxID=521013 RepID=A0A1G7G5K0_9RHOB|nr:DUF4864 domain-containing protein [Limimaricola pyoseonensis]SDE83412.1 protein of unknown function [Limimaricola pyoseonensis]